MTFATAVGVLEELDCAWVLCRNTIERTNCISEANVRADGVETWYCEQHAGMVVRQEGDQRDSQGIPCMDFWVLKLGWWKPYSTQRSCCGALTLACVTVSIWAQRLCFLLRYIRCQKDVGKSFERHKLKRQDLDAW